MRKTKPLTLYSLGLILLLPLMCVNKKDHGNSIEKSVIEDTSSSKEIANYNSHPNETVQVNSASSISSEKNPTKRELPKNWPWRGVSFQSINSDTNDISYLSSIGVNFVRIEVKPSIRAKKKNTEPLQSFYEELAWTERILNSCKEKGMTSIIAFNFLVLDPNSKISDKSPEFWSEKSYQDSAFRMVEIIANKFKNRGDELSGYEVIGEPAVKSPLGAKVPPGIESFYQKTLNVIRKYDKERWFLLSPGPWGTPANYKGFKPYNIKDKHIIYGAHMYLPDEFTHQGVKKRDRNVTYPGKIKSENWNIELIEKRLKLIKKFENEYGYPIYIGEYQAARWSPGADLWVKDVCMTLEKLEFSWSLFAYKAGTEFWDPYFEVVNRKLPVEKWEIKNVGPSTSLWQYMLTQFRKNKNNK